jgi:hypothetical protein
MMRTKDGLYYPEWKYGRGGEIGSFKELSEWKLAGLKVWGPDCPQCGHKCNAHHEGLNAGCSYMHPFNGTCPCGIGSRQAKLLSELDPVPKFLYQRAIPGEFSYYRNTFLGGVEDKIQ